ncbi:hypothetical protein EG352_15530 [Chryseobacterium indologenes]|uniref:Uncharacterized protein n=1 Tax=Chryseobacterium indologenes TaxID=253 RepID=A0AAD0YY52_CHRID|nr:hypothetical protein [Chryseobacterium indologenes]AZB19083.1 hypothetical protein EG352_15530 [Chryseobacterium indologenes]
MKIVYLIPLLFLGSFLNAQENKQIAPVEDQALVVKQIKEREAKLLKENQELAEKKTSQTGLVSDHGSEVKKQDKKTQAQSDHSGNLLPNTASIEEIKKTIPNRQASRNTINSKNINTNVTGLPNTATLQEIKKTIPKN